MNGALRDACGYLSSATLTTGERYSGFYTASASGRLPVTGTVTDGSQLTGTETHRGNTYQVTIRVTRR